MTSEDNVLLNGKIHILNCLVLLRLDLLKTSSQDDFFNNEPVEPRTIVDEVRHYLKSTIFT